MRNATSFSKQLIAPAASLVALCAALALLPRNAPARAEAKATPPVHREAEASPAQDKAGVKSIQITIPGTIEPNAHIELRAPIGGVIEKIGFEEGASVHKGQLLVQLASPGLKAEVAAAEAEFKRSDVEYRRLRGVADRQPQLVAASDLEQAQGAMERSRANLQVKQAHLAQTRIEAPWDGVIGASDIQPGAAVAPNTGLGSLYDLSAFKVRFAVAPEFVRKLHTGQKVQVRIEPGPSDSVAGEICVIAPVLDEATRTLLVKAKLARTNQALRPGMYAAVVLSLPSDD